MKQINFDDLTRLPALRGYQAAFRKATGVTLALVAPEPGAVCSGFGVVGNPFCSLMREHAAGCRACRQDEERLRHSTARRLAVQQIHCYAGLTVVGMPVIVEGRHVATLLSGQVFRREPTQRDFALVVRMLEDGEANGERERNLRQAYFATPVVTPERFQAILDLVKVFARYVADYAGRSAIASQPEEPAAVASAKAYVQSHAEEPVTLTQVAQHVHVSRFHLCKLFRQATGMTLTEYVARCRVEKAKRLLVDHSLRISEVVFAAGFGSIPRFNSVFKEHVGVAPSQYRATLRTEASGLSMHRGE